MINENALMVGGTVVSSAGAGLVYDTLSKLKNTAALRELGRVVSIPRFATGRIYGGALLASAGLGLIGTGLVKRSYNPSTEALTEEAYRRGYERALNATSNAI